jgi:hypothetical protein
MIFSDALTAQLSTLTVALDDPGTDLQTILEVLADDLSAAVSSFLGLRMTLQPGGIPVTLTAIDADPELAAGASLALPLAPLTGAGTGGTVVFYARNPGAFVDLAADIQRVPGPGGRVVLDGHLPDPSDPPQRPGITVDADFGIAALPSCRTPTNHAAGPSPSTTPPSSTRANFPGDDPRTVVTLG